MIRIIQLYKSYGSKTVLQDINLELVPGKVYGVVGANGAGKTTLFKCLTHLESYQGKIESKWHPLKNHLGFLETNPLFMSKITGWEYLKLMCMARDVGVNEFDSKNIFELPLDQYVETYSTGMKKKLALTGVLLQNNEVFVLDEPFNGVDIHSNMIIVELIKRLKQQGKTVLISSHIFSTLQETCDEIMMLKGGVISKQVAPADFKELEAEMKSFVIGDKMDNLEGLI